MGCLDVFGGLAPRATGKYYNTEQNHFDSMANIKANINKLTEEIADRSAEYSSIIC